LARRPQEPVYLLWSIGEQERPKEGPLTGKTYVITGTLERWSREQAAAALEAAGAKALSERDALPLGRDIIHSVTNPIGRLTGAIHVYGGDFFAVPRSEWDPERLVEQPGDVQRTLQLFEENNRLYTEAAGQQQPARCHLDATVSHAHLRSDCSPGRDRSNCSSTICAIRLAVR